MKSLSIHRSGLPLGKILQVLRLWLPVATLYGILAFLSTADLGYDAPAYHPTLHDKIPHFFAFALIGTLVLRAIPPQKTRQLLWRKAILITACLGFTDEVLQFFNRSRTGDPLDWLADVLGASVAITGYLYFRWYQKLLEFPLLSIFSFFLPRRKAQSQ